MPKAYEDIKRAFMNKGVSEAESKTRAAKIYNSRIREQGQPPVTRNYEKTKANWGKKK